MTVCNLATRKSEPQHINLSDTEEPLSIFMDKGSSLDSEFEKAGLCDNIARTRRLPSRRRNRREPDRNRSD